MNIYKNWSLYVHTYIIYYFSKKCFANKSCGTLNFFNISVLDDYCPKKPYLTYNGLNYTNIYYICSTVHQL